MPPKFPSRAQQELVDAGMPAYIWFEEEDDTLYEAFADPGSKATDPVWLCSKTVSPAAGATGIGRTTWSAPNQIPGTDDAANAFARRALITYS